MVRFHLHIIMMIDIVLTVAPLPASSWSGKYLSVEIALTVISIIELGPLSIFGGVLTPAFNWRAISGSSSGYRFWIMLAFSHLVLPRHLQTRANSHVSKRSYRTLTNSRAHPTFIYTSKINLSVKDVLF